MNSLLRCCTAVLLGVFTTTAALAAPPKPAEAVTALAYRPDGTLLAAGGHGVVRLIDPISGEIVGTLPGQTARVTALAFSSDGRHLAVASGTPGKAGEVRLYTVPARGLPTADAGGPIHAHADLVYALAFRPDGKQLATGSYDRRVKLWDAATGKEQLVLKDHSDSVYGLAFHRDGKLLATVAADRAVKVWDVATGRRLYTLGDCTDWVYAVAWSPDGKHLAAAGADQSIRIWEANAEGGKLVRSAFAHTKPVTHLLYAPDGQTLYSVGEDRVPKAWDAAKLAERKAFDAQPESVLALALRPDGKQLALGRFDGTCLLLDPGTGKVQATPLPAKTPPAAAGDRFPAVAEREPNDSAGTGQAVALPVTVAGRLDKAGDVDFFRFEAKAGQEVGVEVTAPGGLRFDPVLTLTDADGEVRAEGGASLGFTCPKAGAYAVGVRDREFRGGSAMTYRLHVGPVPVVTSLFPLGLQRGTGVEVRLEGVNLGDKRTVRVTAPATAEVGGTLPVTVATPFGPPLGANRVTVGEFPEVTAKAGPVPLLAVPATANGSIDRPGVTQTWRFPARKGERLIVETNARRLGSPLDTFVEVLDVKGKPVPRATLRCVAKTYTTFRDHDSAGGGIRLEAWNELAVNDYVLIGGEVARIKELPRNPDDDCQFVTVAGRREGQFGTTPTHHSLGTPVYKVEVHAPGTAFPPNGLPLVTLNYRNDDGGPAYGKDSRLFFDAPADGEYRVRVGDARGEGGPGHAYRLTVRPPRPDFRVTLSPTAPAVWKGGAVPVTAGTERIDGFDGPIDVKLEGLPTGFEAPATRIEAGQERATFALSADAKAVSPTVGPPPKLVARATIAGKEVVREAVGGLPKALEPGDLTTATEVSEVVIRPGHEARLTVTIERRNGFTGRVPLDVRGLPHGVRVLDVGLNGILIPPAERKRTIVLYAEPWVRPGATPFVVLSRREGKNTEHAARSVLLKVAE